MGARSDSSVPVPEMPRRPIPAVIAVLVRNSEVLLVRRAHRPDAGKWGFPGGKMELGESVREAALRELREETQVTAEACESFTTLDIFDYDEDGSLRQQFVLVAVLCRWLSGEPIAGDDALEARWLPLSELPLSNLPMSADVERLARQAAALAATLRQQ